MDNRPYRQAVRVVVFKHDKVCVCEKKKTGGVWYAFPGGGIEDGDSPEVSVEKECLEEVGIVVKNIKPLGLNFTYDITLPNPERAKIYKGGRDFWYRCDYVRKDMALHNVEGDGLVPKWFSLEEALYLMKKDNNTDKSNLDRIKVLEFLMQSKPFLRW